MLDDGGRLRALEFHKVYLEYAQTFTSTQVVGIGTYSFLMVLAFRLLVGVYMSYRGTCTV